MMSSWRIRIGMLALVALASTPAQGSISCTMTFSLKGWSAFYKTARGSGTIKCDNGQTIPVTIQTTGGGLTFGKSKVVDGRGTFSPVESVKELFGSYAVAEAHAGAGRSTDAQALTKGTVSLALAGKGTGINVGFDFGKFTITNAAAAKKK